MSQRAFSLPRVALAALLSLASAGCVVSVDSSEFTAREEKRFEVPGGTPEVALVTFDGSVEVRSWDQAAVKVEIEKRGPNQQLAEAIEVQAEQSGGVIRVEAKRPTGESSGFLRQSPSARIVALVPARSKVSVRSGDGSITVERVEGDLDVDTRDGSVRGYDLAGNLKVHTGDGPVRLEQADGAVDVDTADGTVNLTGQLHAVRVVTGDGTVAVRAEDGSRMAADWEIRTGDGGIRLELPRDFSAELDASTADGRVRLPAMEPGAEPERADNDAAHHDVRRTLGGGGKVLRLRTGDGNVTISNQ